MATARTPELSDAGLYTPTYAETRQEILELFEAAYGEVDDSADSMDGRLIELLTERFQANNLSLQSVNDATEPDNATGAALENISGFSGITRNELSNSTVTLTLAGTPGITVPGDRTVKIQDGSVNEGIEFTIPDAWTFDGIGAASVSATCEDEGPIVAKAGTITEIVTPIPGWTSVTNAGDTIPGRYLETDPELKARRETSLARPGSGTQNAIEAYLLDEVDGVTDAKVFSNNSSVIVTGIDPYSIECIVDGGATQDIGEAIFYRGGVTVSTSGDIPVTVQDSGGYDQEIDFSRPADFECYMHVELLVNSSFNKGTAESYNITVDTAVVGEVYSVKVNGVTYAYTAVGGDTAIIIALRLYTLAVAGTYRDFTTLYFPGADSFTITSRYNGNPTNVTVTSNLTKLELIVNSGNPSDIISNISDFSSGVLLIDGVNGGNYKSGDDVYVDDFIAAIKKTKNIKDATVYIGTTAVVPTLQNPILPTIRQKPIFIADRITVNAT